MDGVLTALITLSTSPLLQPAETRRAGSDPGLTLRTHFCVWTCLHVFRSEDTLAVFCRLRMFPVTVIDARHPCDSLQLSARLNDESRNPSEVTAHVHHHSLSALIVLFKVKLYLLSALSFLDNKQLRPAGKILHDSCCRSLLCSSKCFPLAVQGEVRMTR